MSGAIPGIFFRPAYRCTDAGYLLSRQHAGWLSAAKPIINPPSAMGFTSFNHPTNYLSVNFIRIVTARCVRMLTHWGCMDYDAVN
jgi:hypothetical protein